MARVPSHLILRGGVYNYRRRVPAERRTDPIFKGRDVYQVSLGVRTLTEARRRVLDLKLDDLFRVHHLPVEREEDGTVLSPSLLTRIAQQQYERGLDHLHRSRSTEGADEQSFRDDLAAQDIGLSNDPSRGTATRQRLHRELEPVLRASAEATVARLGLPNDEPTIQKVIGALFEAELNLTGARVDLAGGKTLPTAPTFAAPSSANSAPAHREAHWTFKKLAQAALRQHPKGESWTHKVETVADLFDEYLGPTPIYKIDRRKVRDFMNDIQFMPTSMSLRFPGMTLKEAISANETRKEPFRTVSPNTARDGYFSILRWVFNHAVELEALPANPCTGIRIKGAVKSNGKQKRNPFTVDELNAFFRLPVFTGCLSPLRPNTPGDFAFDDHRKWAPLIMLFSGARTSEIAQLAVSDVKCHGPHPYISILTEYDPDDPDEDRDFVVSHKTANARRDIPIHPDLIELGFLSYVDARRQAGDIRLFPDWTLPAAGRKLYSSASWIRNLNDRLIPKITNRRPKPTLYSFRHTWKTQMALAQVPVQYQNQVLGHAQSGMDEHYLGRLDIEHTHQAIKVVRFRGLDLSHLKS